MKPELEKWFMVHGRELEVQFCRSLERCIQHASLQGISYKTMDIGRLMFYFHKDLINLEEMEEVE